MVTTHLVINHQKIAQFSQSNCRLDNTIIIRGLIFNLLRHKNDNAPLYLAQIVNCAIKTGFIWRN